MHFISWQHYREDSAKEETEPQSFLPATITKKICVFLEGLLKHPPVYIHQVLFTFIQSTLIHQLPYLKSSDCDLMKCTITLVQLVDFVWVWTFLETF